MSHAQLATQFFLQLAVLLGACRVVGLLAARLGQPQVVAEMIAGVLLGPSLLGLLQPGLQAALFPPATLSTIYVVAQVGLSLYMFLVGVEFRRDLVTDRIRSALAVSVAGIAVPFVLGALLAAPLLADGRFFSPQASLEEAALFLGAAMSITAFPMLARILYERGLAGTQLGAIALAAGASDDAAAWCLLAIVVASFSGDATVAAWAIGGGAAYAVLVLGVLRPLLAPLGPRVEVEGRMSRGTLTLVLLLLSIGAWFTDWAGIYSVFGAFILGSAMPRGRFAEELQRLLEPLTVGLLLPLFFVYSGLNTRLAFLAAPDILAVALIVIVAASAGKGLACWAAARLTGYQQREALAIGALMNARGLMELILLNIGLERGVITPVLFTVMVTMAVVTTLATGPAFEALYRRGFRGAPAPHGHPGTGAGAGAPAQAVAPGPPPERQRSSSLSR